MKTNVKKCHAPCSSCPWRKSNPTDGSAIPNFDLDLMRGLRSTVGVEDGFRKVMSCHGSTNERPHACRGYVAVEGIKNLNVRLLAIRGDLDIAGIQRAGARLDLWPSFDEMLAAFETTLANSSSTNDNGEPT